jgi:carbon-monoxide dehydrogenase large subunit
MGGNAVAKSAEKVLEKAKRIAANRLEIDVADIAYENGTFHAAGIPQRTLSFAEVAKAAYSSPPPEGDEPGLDETTFFSPDGTAHTFGTHVAVVEVDTETGEIDVERYVAVDDCGRRINPLLVEGQIHGGIAQGIGQALYEHAVYDDNGTLITGSHMDYTVPKAHHLPDFETIESVTPTDQNPLGAKGIGEAGTTASPPAIVNAVVDALEPFGIDHIDMPLTAEKVWRAIHEDK